MKKLLLILAFTCTIACAFADEQDNNSDTPSSSIIPCKLVCAAGNNYCSNSEQLCLKGAAASIPGLCAQEYSNCMAVQSANCTICSIQSAPNND